MTNTLKYAGCIVLGIVVGALIGLNVHSTLLSGVYSQVSNHFGQGLYAGDGDEFSVNATGGTATLSTSNTATSSLIVGCIQQYPTSTATAVRQIYNAGFAASTTYAGVNSNGTVMWAYGTCPNL